LNQIWVDELVQQTQNTFDIFLKKKLVSVFKCLKELLNYATTQQCKIDTLYYLYRENGSQASETKVDLGYPGDVTRNHETAEQL
jgi:hypothetical protein